MVPRRDPKPVRETAAYRWSRVIQHRPWVAAAAGATVLCSCWPCPVLSLRLGFSDESNFAQETTTKQAYDLLVDGFGEGFNGPLLLVAELPDGADLASVAAIGEAAAADRGVAFVSPPQPNDPDAPTAVLWTVVPTTGPQDEATTDLVDRLRARRAAAGRGGGRHPGGGHRQRGREPGLLPLPVVPLPVLLRGRPGPVVPAAHGGLPVAAGAAQGGGHEPACRSGPPTGSSSPSSSGGG